MAILVQREPEYFATHTAVSSAKFSFSFHWRAVFRKIEVLRRLSRNVFLPILVKSPKVPLNCQVSVLNVNIVTQTLSAITSTFNEFRNPDNDTPWVETANQAILIFLVSCFNKQLTKLTDILT